MKLIRFFVVLTVFLIVSGFTECYKPVTNSGLPKRIKTVAVPAFQFEAKGFRYRVESRFTEAVMKEIIKRGKGLKVQGTREGADAVMLSGETATGQTVSPGDMFVVGSSKIECWRTVIYQRKVPSGIRLLVDKCTNDRMGYFSRSEISC